MSNPCGREHESCEICTQLRVNHIIDLGLELKKDEAKLDALKVIMSSAPCNCTIGRQRCMMCRIRDVLNS